MKHERIVRQMVEHHKELERNKGAEEGIRWWQLSLIGIGSIIGAGFFLGTSLSITLTGPSVLIAYLIAGLIGFITFSALTEMTVNDLDPGSFRAYARKAFGHSMGFISGWVYWVAGVLIISSEITALSVFTQYWFSKVPLWIFAIIYSLLGLGINLLGVKDFGKIESFFAIVKIVTLIIFIIFGIGALVGLISPAQSGSQDSVITLSNINWFPKGVKGLWSAMIFALFPFGGIAVVGVASNELKDKESIPKAVNILIVSLIVLYIASIFIVLKMVSWPQISQKQSPFVTALSAFNIPYISSVFNIVIISAAFSTLVGALFSITNVMLSLAQDRDAPKAFMKKNSRGVAIKALMLSAIGLAVTIFLSFLLPKTVYEYMTTAAGVLLILNWCIILASQIKNRKKYADIAEGKNRKFKMILYPYSSYLGIILILLSLGGALFRQTERMGLFVSLGIIAIITISYFWVKPKNQ